MMKAYVFAFLFSIVNWANAYAQLSLKLDSVIQQYVKTDEPGIALLVENKGDIVYKKGFGMANKEAHTLIQPETNFRMASVSKQFTAMGVLLLEKAHQLSFDDPLSRYFPEMNPKVANKVRIRHLLTHSSGIIDYEAVMDPHGQMQLLDQDVYALIKDADSTYFEPGTQFRYSNSGFCLLALLIERISKQSFSSFITKRIFEPLHMNSSRVYEAGANIPHRAMGYARDARGNIRFSDQSLTSATKGDGGIYTSLQDYLKWSEAIRKHTLLNLQKSLARLHFSIPQAPGHDYGAGWFYTDPTNLALFHSGSTCGFSTFVIHIPDKQLLLVYFSNIADNSEPFREILGVLAAEGFAYPTDIFSLHRLTM